MKPTADILGQHIDAAMGWRKPDRVIRGVNVLNVKTGEQEITDIAISGGTIVSVYEKFSDEELQGVDVIDGTGKTAVPGFINTHGHIESSILPPLEYDRVALPFGETAFITDPHEAANVMGPEAFAFWLKSSAAAAMDIIVQLSSCVPATSLETSGATITAKDIAKFMDDPNAGSLAEMMNIGGVLNKDPDVLAKLLLYWNHKMPIDGHMPGVRGRSLNALQAAGIRNDHESTSYEEGREKLKKGIQILIRNGTVCKDLKSLFSLISKQNAPQLCFCTDDMKPHDIVRGKGTIASIIREAIAMGADPVDVYRIATLSAAEHFGLRDRGFIGAGRRADIVLLNDLNACDVHLVIKDGRTVTPELFAARPKVSPVGYGSVRLKDMTAADFVITSEGCESNVIGLGEGVLTVHEKAQVRRAADGTLPADPANDLLKLAVLERHGKNGNMAHAFVKGFGMKEGALASTVAHDHHNVMVVGADDADMALAANHLKKIGGGFVVVKNGKVLGDLPLPLMGLMSDQPYEKVINQIDAVNAAAGEICPKLPAPFMTLSFLGLCVIPLLKLSDFGITRFDPANGDKWAVLVDDQRKNGPKIA